jgi:hypothetical protein
MIVIDDLARGSRADKEVLDYLFSLLFENSKASSSLLHMQKHQSADLDRRDRSDSF